MQDLTPRQIVAELDKFIIGQHSAKRAISIALRNRVRRQLVPEGMRDEITPKNLMLIGPTGVGKTEIARRVAKLIDAPFLKVEATKFTEVGYVGRDVESIVRDLVETAFNLEHDQRIAAVRDEAESMANERIINYIMEQRTDLQSKLARKSRTRIQAQAQGGGPALALPAQIEGGSAATITTTLDSDIRPAASPTSEVSERALKVQRRKVARLLAEHKLDEEQIEIDLSDIGMDNDDLGGVLEFSPGMSAEEMTESFADFIDGYRSMQSSLNGLGR